MRPTTLWGRLWVSAPRKDNGCSSPGCGKPRRPCGRYCRECHAAYQRRWNAKQKQENQEARAMLDRLRKANEESLRLLEMQTRNP